MFRELKKFTIQMIAGANVASIVILWLIGYSDRLNPEDYPMLSNIGLLFPVFLLINFFFLLFWLVFKKRYALIPFLGFLACYIPVRKYMPLNVDTEVPNGAIKVLSYNTLGFGEGQMDEDGVNPVVRYIRQQDADIVCLQEAGMSEPVREQVDSILRPKYISYEITVHPNGGNSMVLLCKFPLLSKEVIDYPSEANFSVAYRLKIGKDTVLLVSNHLESTGLTLEERSKFKNLIKGKLETQTAEKTSKLLIVKLAESTKKRAPEAKAVADYIKHQKEKSVILCGDFNDGPISYAHRTIAEGLTDCYITSGNGPGISYHKGGFFVRIDNMMCSDDWKPYNCKIDDKIAASDHYPIVCYLKKRSKK